MLRLSFDRSPCADDRTPTLALLFGGTASLSREISESRLTDLREVHLALFRRECNQSHETSIDSTIST